MTDEKRRFYEILQTHFEEWGLKTMADGIQDEIATAYSQLTGAPADSPDAINFVYFVGGFHAGVDIATIMDGLKKGRA